MSEPATVLSLPIDTHYLRNEVLYFREIDSTNAFLLRQAHPSGTIVLADYQTAGRGRRGRIWEAPAGEALLFSFSLTANPTVTPLFVYSLLTAIGVRHALHDLEPMGDFCLKWPNDVLLGRHKVCGILVQNKIENAHSVRIVVGVGVNVNQGAEFFQDLPLAGSLFSLTGKKFDRLLVLTRIVQRLDDLLQPAIVNDPPWIIQHWQMYCPFIGKLIQVDDGRRIHAGLFVGLTENGALRLQNAAGESHFNAADVTIKKE